MVTIDIRSGRRLLTGAVFAAALAIGLARPAAAGEDFVPLVDGTMWLETSTELKRAYLIGVSNLLNIEYAYQMEKGPPPDMQTTIQRFYEGVEDLSLDQTIQRIDDWYKKNPTEKNRVVLEVVWIDMVEPNLPDHRKE